MVRGRSCVSGKTATIRKWWGRLVLYGPEYGYFPNASKTAVLMEENRYEDAVTAFEGTGITITDDGKRYLGGTLGSEVVFLENFVEIKVSEWTRKIERLSTCAKYQPHAAFSAFTHGVSHRWSYLTRVLPISDHLLQPLERVIRCTLLPEVTGQPACSDTIWRLFSLPPTSVAT